LLGLQDSGGYPGAEDPVERVSSKVQAVACISPPCDFLNWGSRGVTIFHHPTLEDNPIFIPAFDFRKQDTTNFKIVSISDTNEINKILWQVSPINYITPDDPPVSIIHGDHNDLVPFQQSEQLILKLQQNNIASQLKAMKSESHNTFPASDRELYQICVDWFNKYLK
jgi:BD-FAE protein